MSNPAHHSTLITHHFELDYNFPRMTYNSLPFLFVFFPLFFIAYFLLARTRLKNLVLLGGSLAFVALAGTPLTPAGIRAAALVNLPVLGGVVLVNYGLGRMLERARDLSRPRAQRSWLWIGIIFNVLLLALIKTGVYLQQNAAGLPGPLASLASGFALQGGFVAPVGISYIAFQAIAYLIDIYKKVTTSESSLVDFSVFLLMFPKLLTGPIARYRTVQGELRERSATPDCVAEGLRRFVQGLAKKTLIADQLGRITAPFFAAARPDFSTGISWLVLAAYTLQIYYDFSGYTDMAIGMGAMLGFHLPENFHRPYAALGIADFWRRWHITLSFWFRDYVFLPLEYARRRVKRFRAPTDVLVVFLLTGLWHGISPTFIVWGLWQGIWIIFEQSDAGQFLQRLPVIVQRGYFFLVMMIGWAFFRSPNLAFAGEFLLNLAGLRKPAQALPFAVTTPLPVIDPSIWLVIALGSVFLLPWGAWLAPAREWIAARVSYGPREVANLLLAAALLVLSLSAIASTIQFASIYAMF